MTLRRAFCAVLALTLVAATPAPSPTPASSPAPASSLTPSPSPAPSAALVRFAGQVLDEQGGFIFFTTGDGFRLNPDVRYVDAAGNETSERPRTRLYAQATFDASGSVVQIAVGTHPFPPGAAYEQVRQYAVVTTPKQPNPQFSHPREGIEGKPVAVTFTVEVPPNTPLTDTVYLSTDKSLWVANAVRMDRIDALHYRYTVKLNSGTDLYYLYTRGTWTTVERGRDGLEERPHHLFVQNLDTETRSDQVYYWADLMTSGPNPEATFNPAVLPTPFNPNPFPSTFPTPKPPVPTPH
ncbi:MAG: hypothetical protein JOZ38_12540 [Candidatus Eremiobacteraeota bacterium]|nr:hypothetical protein [Candidatus Eremiobacteraeota bacterium]